MSAGNIFIGGPVATNDELGFCQKTQGKFVRRIFTVGKYDGLGYIVFVYHCMFIIFFPFEVAKDSYNGVKSVQCGGEIEIFIDIKSATDDVDKNPGKPLLDVFACQHPHSDNAQRRCETVQPRNVTVCVFDKYPGDADERHDKHKE